MTLKEALRIVKEFGFTKRTVTTTESGAADVYHYFSYKIGDVPFMLGTDESKSDDQWYGSIFDYGIKFYTIESFASLLLTVKSGEWQESNERR